MRGTDSTAVTRAVIFIRGESITSRSQRILRVLTMPPCLGTMLQTLSAGGQLHHHAHHRLQGGCCQGGPVESTVNTWRWKVKTAVSCQCRASCQFSLYRDQLSWLRSSVVFLSMCREMLAWEFTCDSYCYSPLLRGKYCEITITSRTRHTALTATACHKNTHYSVMQEASQHVVMSFLVTFCNRTHHLHGLVGVFVVYRPQKN